MFLGYQVNYAGSLPNFPPAISQFGTLYCFGQETILLSVRCVRQRVLEEEKAAEDVIYVVSDGSFGQCKCRCPFLFSLLDSMY